MSVNRVNSNTPSAIASAPAHLSPSVAAALKAAVDALPEAARAQFARSVDETVVAAASHYPTGPNGTWPGSGTTRPIHNDYPKK